MGNISFYKYLTPSIGGRGDSLIYVCIPDGKTETKQVKCFSLLQILVAQADGEEKTGDTKEIGNKRNKPL